MRIQRGADGGVTGREWRAAAALSASGSTRAQSVRRRCQQGSSSPTRRRGTCRRPPASEAAAAAAVDAAVVAADVAPTTSSRCSSRHRHRRTLELYTNVHRSDNERNENSCPRSRIEVAPTALSRPHDTCSTPPRRATPHASQC